MTHVPTMNAFTTTYRPTWIASALARRAVPTPRSSGSGRPVGFFGGVVSSMSNIIQSLVLGSIHPANRSVYAMRGTRDPCRTPPVERDPTSGSGRRCFGLKDPGPGGDYVVG